MAVNGTGYPLSQSTDPEGMTPVPASDKDITYDNGIRKTSGHCYTLEHVTQDTTVYAIFDSSKADSKGIGYYTVSKVDPTGQAAAQPEPVDLYEPVPAPGTDNTTFTLNQANGWTLTWDDEDLDESNYTYAYELRNVEESNTDDFAFTQGLKTETPDPETGKLTVHFPLSNQRKVEPVNIPVVKRWDPMPEDEAAAYVTVKLHRYAKATKGTFTVELKTEEGSPIEDATFTLYKDGEVFRENLKTNEKGQISQTGLEPGVYYYKQVDTPAAYTMAGCTTQTPEWKVEADKTTSQSETKTLTNKAKKAVGAVTLSLKDAVYDTAIGGATFDLYKGSDLYRSGLITNGEGLISEGNLEAGTYRFVQTGYASGYKPDVVTFDPPTFTVDASIVGETQQKTVGATNTKIAKGSATVTLTRKDNGSPISGAKFALLQNGAVLEEATTNGSGQLSFTNLGVGSYVIKQATTIGDLSLAENQPFEIEDNGRDDQTKDFALTNDVRTGKITVELHRTQGGTVGYGQNTGGHKKVDDWKQLKPGTTIRVKITRVQSGHDMYYCTDYRGDGYGTWTKIGDNDWNGNDYYLSYTIPSSPEEATYKIGVSSSWGIDSGSVAFMNKPASGAGTNSVTTATHFAAPRAATPAPLGAGNDGGSDGQGGGSGSSTAPTIISNPISQEAPSGYVEDSSFTREPQTLRHTDDPATNWRYVFEDLEKYDPDGNEYVYYVEEVDYEPKDYRLVEMTTENDGTIVIKNEKADETGDLVVTKTLQGKGTDAAPSGTYTYPITVTTVIGSTTYYVAFNSTENKYELTTTATQLSVTNGTPLTLAGLPVTHEGAQLTYKVEEVDPSSVQVVDYTNVTVAGTTVETVDGIHLTPNGSVEAGLVNVYERDKGNLKLSKTIEGTDAPDERFSFTVVLTAPNGVNFDTSYPTVSTPNGGAATEGTQAVTNGEAFTVTLNAGDTWQINNLPKGTEYTVTEGTIPGWTQTGHTNDTGELSEAGATVEVTFTNTYSEVVKAPQVTKLLKGREWQEDEVFSFTLAPDGEATRAAIDAGKVVMPDPATAEATKTDQTATFGDITFKDEGIYYFIIEEEQGTDTGLTYSGKVVRVKVEVNKTDAELTATMTYIDVKDDAGVDVSESYGSEAKTFTNTKKPGNLELTKNVEGDGADLTKKFAFTIELTAPEGETLADSYAFKKGEDDADGITYTRTEEKTKATVTGIALKADDVFTIVGLPAGTFYEITETDYSEDGYSPSIKKGNWTGRITGGGTEAKEEVAVTNTYEPGKLVIEKLVEGTADNAGKTFGFEVVITGNNHGNGHAGSYTIGETTNDFDYTNGEARITFELMGGQQAEFSVKNKKDVSFTVRETSADADGFETTVKAEGADVNADKTVSGAFSNSAITVEYTNTRNKTSAEATKVWKSGEDEIAWPEDVQSVEFTLYKRVNGKETVVTAEDLTSNGFDATDFANPVPVTRETEDLKASWPTLPTQYYLQAVAADPDNEIAAVEAGWYEATYRVAETKVTYTDNTTVEGDAVAAAFGAANVGGVITNIPLTEISGTKTWSVPGDLPADPTLQLTRKSSAQGATAEVVKDPDDETKDLQPTWSVGEDDNTRSYTYASLPKYDLDGHLYTYTVKETGFTYDGVEYVIRDDGKVYKVVEDADPELADYYWTMTQTDNAITNTLAPASLEVIKVKKGDDAVKLPGAEFELTRKNSAGAYEAFENEAFAEIEVNETKVKKGPFSVGSEGDITITGLVPGDYKLKETKAPAGYIITVGEIYFTINIDGTVTVSGRTENAGTITYSDKNNMVTFTQRIKTAGGAGAIVTVQNEPGVALPNTGSTGTGLFYGLGALMILIAGIGIALDRKRRNA